MAAQGLNLIQAISTTAEERRRDFVSLTVFGSFLSLKHMGRENAFVASTEHMGSL